MGRAGAGELTYIDLKEEDRERLIWEANQLMKGEGYDPDVEYEGTTTAAGQDPVPPSEAPRIWTPDSPGDEFGIINRNRLK